MCADGEGGAGGGRGSACGLQPLFEGCHEALFSQCTMTGHMQGLLHCTWTPTFFSSRSRSGFQVFPPLTPRMLRTYVISFPIVNSKTKDEDSSKYEGHYKLALPHLRLLASKFRPGIKAMTSIECITAYKISTTHDTYSRCRPTIIFSQLDNDIAPHQGKTSDKPREVLATW